MFSVALILLLAAGSCVNSIDLIQPDSMLVQPGQSLTITCQVSGYSLTDNSYATGWIRQREGKPLDWILHRRGGGDFWQNNALKNKFLYHTHTSTSSVTLTGQNLQPEDTAVYYCVRQQGYAFDYWGKGTEVTVSSLTAASPTVFPLVQCNSGTADTVTVGCIAQDFFPKSLTFQWTDDSGTTLTSEQYPTTVKDSKYTGVSVLNLSKSDWDSRKNFSCSVTHSGESKSVRLQKPPPPPPPKAPITVTLNQPSPKEMFNNNQVKLECVITGQDQNIINGVQIIWQINGQKTTDRITTTNSGGSKISTMTRTHTEWQGVNKVSCSAIRDNMTPVIQDLTIQKGDAKDTKVTVHVLTEEDIGKEVSSEVTLVCLVSSRAQQDYYIAWTEDSGRNAGTFTDGINFPPQKTQNGYVVTSVYTTTKKKWDDNNTFSCNVWPAGSESKTHRGVSKGHSNSVEYSPPESKLDFALSCIDGATEVDEYSSLWSTTSSFIFLFICSLLYSTIISLVKIK